jgi:hypothetical protein
MLVSQGAARRPCVESLHPTRPNDKKGCANNDTQGPPVKRFALDCFARLALAFFSAMVLGSCGSGAVSGPAPVNDPTRITILPATATLYSGAPTTFVISGGTGSYIVSSSNQAVIPVSGSVTTGTLILVPNPVIADTPVTLTVRDTGTTPLATATLTVPREPPSKPRTPASPSSRMKRDARKHASARSPARKTRRRCCRLPIL